MQFRRDTCVRAIHRQRKRVDRERTHDSKPCDSSNRWRENPSGAQRIRMAGESGHQLGLISGE